VEEAERKCFITQIMYSASETVELTLELFHFQTNTSLQFPPNIDVSGLPDSDVASRIHAQIWVNADAPNNEKISQVRQSLLHG
ncbi:MAG: hypothetical protein ACYTX0_55355, partial [Nostoc sp.]